MSSVTALGIALSTVSGCASREHIHRKVAARDCIVAVVPVLNLSGSKELDPQRITDLIASELVSFEGVRAIPISRVLAELARRGRSVVGSPDEAVAVGRALGADATLVTAITEYDPYHPPVVGLTMQWYVLGSQGASPLGRPPRPLDEPRSTHNSIEPTDSATTPLLQVQRVYNAAVDEVRDDVRDYARKREGHDSPWGWRKYLQCQELYVRYCGWATIRTMLRPECGEPATAGPDHPEQVEP